MVMVNIVNLLVIGRWINCDEGLEELLKKSFPFTTRYYETKDFDYSYRTIVLGVLDKTLCYPKNATIIDSEPLIIGDYSIDFEADDIRYRINGKCHEIVVTSNNKIITRGSNANGQLNIPDSLPEDSSIYCGDYFTAILSNGRVTVNGYIGSIKHEVGFSNSFTPNKDVTLRPEDIEQELKVGSSLSMQAKGSKYNIYHLDHLIGTLKTNIRHKKDYVPYVFSYLEPKVSSFITDIENVVKRTKQEMDIDFYSITKSVLDQYNIQYLAVENWKDIVEVFPMENGLLGKQSNNEYLFDGEVNNILKLINLINQEGVTNV